MAVNRARRRGYKFDDRLVANPHGILGDASPEKLHCRPLFLWKPIVKPIDQNVGVNESGFVRGGPRASIRDRGQAGPCGRRFAAAGAWWLTRTSHE